MVKKTLHSITSNIQTSLSKNELFDIINDINRDYAPVHSSYLPDLDNCNKLSKNELLEVSNNISLYYAPKLLSNYKKLVILPVDPEHLYVYWNIIEYENKSLIQTDDKEEFILRVYPQEVEIKHSSSRTINSENLKPLLEVPVHGLRSGQTITLPSQQESTVYSASIGQTDDNNVFIPILNSNLSYPVEGSLDQNINHSIETWNSHSSSITGKVNQLDNNVLLGGQNREKSHFARNNDSGIGKKIKK